MQGVGLPNQRGREKIASIPVTGLQQPLDAGENASGTTHMRKKSPETSRPGSLQTEPGRLHEMLNIYSIVAEKSPAGIFISQEGCFRWVSGKLCESTGYAADELNGVSCLSFVHPEDRERVRQGARAMLRGETSSPYEYRMVKKGGELLWCLESVSPIRFDGSRAVFGSQVDITCQKQTADALRESEERYRMIIDSIPDAYYEIDLAGNNVTFNDSFLRLYEYGREEMQGVNYRTYVDSQNVRVVTRVFRHVYKTGRPVKKTAWQITTKSGHKKQIELSVTLVLDSRGTPKGFRGIMSDVTARCKAEELIRQQAFHDPLTGLANRTLFYDRLTMALNRAKRDRKMVAVMILDLDHFKDVNDHRGHAVGDKLLKSVAARLLEMVRAMDTVARHGGDEFTLILPSLNDVADAENIAQKIVEVFEEPFNLEGRELAMTASLGLAMYPVHGTGADNLMRRADAAMYRAKALGRNRYCCFASSNGER